MTPPSKSTAAAPTASKPGVFTLEIPRAALERCAAKFPEGVNVLIVPPQEVQPEFIRLPKAGEKCPVTGLPRTTLIELLESAGERIKVRYLRKLGATTGIKLIPRQQLIDYINTLPTPAEDEEDDE